MGRKQTRKVHIGDEVWTYIVGDRFLSIRDPQGKRTVVPRRASYPTPQIMKDYIWEKLHPVRKLAVPCDTADAKAMVINLFCGARKQL